MRSRLSHLALAALLTVPTALADITSVGTFQPVDPLVKSKIDASVTLTFDQMKQEIVLGVPIQTSLDQLSDLVDLMPRASQLRARLAHHVQELGDRASRSFVDEADLARIRQQFVYARLEHAMEKLRARAVGGGWTPDQVSDVVAQWTAQSRIFIDGPDPAEYRARIAAAAQIAAVGATSAAEAILEMRLMLLQGRLEEARAELLQRVKEGLDSRSDYLRLIKLMGHRARLVAAEGIGS